MPLTSATENLSISHAHTCRPAEQVPDTATVEQAYLKQDDKYNHQSTEPVSTLLTNRATTTWNWIPFKGSIRAFQKNHIKKPTPVIPEKVPEDVAVLLVNNKHPSIVLGGFDSSISNPNARADMEKHVFSWFPSDVDKANKRIYIAAGVATAVNESIYQLLNAEEYDYPRLLAGLTGLMCALMIYTVNPIKNKLMSLISSQGKNSPSIFDRVLAIPIKGLDVNAMQVKAEEIKQKGEFCILGTNCSQSVLEILKTGLPKDIIKRLKEPFAWTTPTDIENIADFLTEQPLLKTGTIDSEGNVIFYCPESGS